MKSPLRKALGKALLIYIVLLSLGFNLKKKYFENERLLFHYYFPRYYINSRL